MKVAKITHPGSASPLYMEPFELEELEDVAGAGPYTVEFVDMPRREFESLPEWDGP